MERVFTPISASGNTCFTFFKYGKIYSGKTERLLIGIHALFIFLTTYAPSSHTQYSQIPSKNLSATSVVLNAGLPVAMTTVPPVAANCLMAFNVRGVIILDKVTNVPSKSNATAFGRVTLRSIFCNFFFG